MSYQVESDRIRTLITKYRFKRCSIGGVDFLINPSKINFPDEHFISEVPTAAGYGRYWWGQKPRLYSLDGTVGVYGKDHLDQMNVFRPSFGREDRRFEFKFPARFSSVRYVNVNKMEDYLTSQFPNMTFYHIEMTEYPPAVPTYVKTTSLAAGAVPATGTSPLR